MPLEQSGPAQLPTAGAVANTGRGVSMGNRTGRRRTQVVDPAEWHDDTARDATARVDKPAETNVFEFEPDDAPTTVYYLHAADHTLLYVGITVTANGFARFAQHAEDKTWWTEVAYASVEHLPSRIEAELREAEAIAALDPIYNIRRPAIRSPGGVRLCACGCKRPAPKSGEGSTRTACRSREYRNRAGKQ